MLISKGKKLTDLPQVFLEARNATHRLYEALRSFFVEGLSRWSWSANWRRGGIFREKPGGLEPQIGRFHRESGKTRITALTSMSRPPEVNPTSVGRALVPRSGSFRNR